MHVVHRKLKTNVNVPFDEEKLISIKQYVEKRKEGRKTHTT